MPQRADSAFQDAAPYSAALTRERFLFHEMRTTARLLNAGLDKEAVVGRIVSENLFQYPTEKSVRRMALACVRRLEAMRDDGLVAAIAEQPGLAAKQVCLYAMMRQYRLVWDFMLTVVGDKYRNLDSSFGKTDLTAFFARLREQDDRAAAWSASTVAKLRQVLANLLVENEYLDSPDAGRLNPVLISPPLERGIRKGGLEIALPAFNCLT